MDGYSCCPPSSTNLSTNHSISQHPVPSSPSPDSGLLQELQTSFHELQEAPDLPFPAPDLTAGKVTSDTNRKNLLSPGSSLSELLTVVLTTSPVQSNPSTAVLSRVLSSFRLVPGLEECSKVVIFDGYEVHSRNEVKSGRVTEEQAKNYEEYVARVQHAMSGSAEALAQAKRYTITSRVTRRAACDVDVTAVPAAPSSAFFGYNGDAESRAGCDCGDGERLCACQVELSDDWDEGQSSCGGVSASALGSGERGLCRERENTWGGGYGSYGGCGPVVGEASGGSDGAGGCDGSAFAVEVRLRKALDTAQVDGCGSCHEAQQDTPLPPHSPRLAPLPSIAFLRPRRRLGFALATRAALSAVRTPYVMVAQHDWAFSAPLDACAIVRAMQEHDKWVHYVGFVSAGTIAYAAGKGAAHIGLPALEEEAERFGIPLVKLCFWYDKTHIARTDHYRRFVFGHGRFRKGDFIEDTFGHRMLEDIKANGMDAHEKYGAFLYYEGGGLRRYLHHIDGRKFLLPAQKAEKEAVSRAAGNGGRRRKKQVEREKRESEKRQAEASSREEDLTECEWSSWDR